MESGNKELRSLDIGKILQTTINLIGKNFRLLLSIALFGQIFGLIAGILNASLANPLLLLFKAALYLVNMIVCIWATAALIKAAGEQYHNIPINFKEAFTRTKSLIWSFMGVSALYVLLIALGWLLFIIPGIYWGIIFCLAGTVLVLEKTNFIDAFKISKTLIRGHFWKVIFLFFIFSIIQSFFFGAILYFSLLYPQLQMGLYSLMMVFSGVVLSTLNIVLYNQLKDIHGLNLPVSEGKKKWGFGCLGCLGALIMAILFLALASMWLVQWGAFVKSEQGTRLWQKAANTFSPVLRFPENIILVRPQGYWAFPMSGKEFEYTLMTVQEGRLNSFKIEALSPTELGLDPENLILDNGLIGDKILEKDLKEAKLLGEDKNIGFKDSARIVDIDGRRWERYEVKWNDELRTNGRRVSLYTIEGDYIFVIFYDYYESHPLTQNEEAVVRPADEDIKNIIREMKFPINL